MDKYIKIAYIGGGSKQWARVFMTDLALTSGLSGEIALYDIDITSAIKNQKIGEIINKNPKALSKFTYKVYDNAPDALKDATFVVMSILPGTFDEMESDVHAPEEYGVYQSVGDTVGPGGVLRAMRTVPIYEEYAKLIKEFSPNAWVINFTNPMNICTKTLYDCFPEIKAFGCCHEVFNAQDFLTCVLKEETGIEVKRNELITDASGINHFTWISEAKYKDIDVLKLIPSFKEKFFEEGYSEHGDRFSFKTDPFSYGNKVKMDLYEKYNVLAAAGDRHLVEFIDGRKYLSDKTYPEKWAFSLTTVDYRRALQEERINETNQYVSGEKEFILEKSKEEAVELMKAILGFKDIVSNVNLPNIGQVPQLKLGSIVESNCYFKLNEVKPIISKPLPDEVASMIRLNLENIDQTYLGIKSRNLNLIFEAFKAEPLLIRLSEEEKYKLFKKMCYNTRKYLDEYFDLEALFKILCVLCFFIIIFI